MATPQRKTAVLSSSEQAALLRQPNQKAPTGLRNLCMLMLMLRAGLRAGEVLCLRVSNINFEKGKIHIAESGAAKERTLWLDDDLVELLSKWEKIRPQGSNYFFTTLKGKPLKDRYLREMVKRLSRKAGIKKDVHPHLLRSTFAVNLIRETNDIRLAQSALGHRDSSTTQSYIKHLFSEHSMTYYDILGYRRCGIPAEEEAVEEQAVREDDYKARGGQGEDVENVKIAEDVKRREDGMTEKPGHNKNNWGIKEEMKREEKRLSINPRPTEPEEEKETSMNCSNGQDGQGGDESEHHNPTPEKQSWSESENSESGNDEEKNPEPSIFMESGENSSQKKPIPAIKCSSCSYIIRYQEDCPKCGASFASILKHWKRNI